MFRKKTVNDVSLDTKSEHKLSSFGNISSIFKDDSNSSNTRCVTIGMKDIFNDIEFFVVDNGVGISDKDQMDLFKKFYQVDTSSKRKTGGSGLGLVICKGIIEGLRDKIWVNSKKIFKQYSFLKFQKTHQCIRK